MLPKHGKVPCNRCFHGQSNTAIPHPYWRMTNDPGAWGSNSPRYLVLGFSKGSTQADVYARGRFEDVAFAGMRPRLTQALKAMGVLQDHETIDARIANPNSDIAFGSLIRCSVSRLDEKASQKQGQPVYGCTGPLITKSFTEIPEVIQRCVQQHLMGLPATVKAVFFLGNTDKYVLQCQDLIQQLFPGDFRRINPMGVFADGRVWVHLAHPSGLNGHFNAWMINDTGPGKKRKQAQEALSLHQVKNGTKEVVGRERPVEKLRRTIGPNPKQPKSQTITDEKVMTYKIYAQGKNDIYVPYQDAKGKYPLYSRLKMKRTGDPIHHASNKVLVDSLEEAIRLVKQGTHHIRLKGRHNKQCNVFAPDKVTITV